MKKEVENEQMNRKRKHNGIEVYSDLNRNRWNKEGGYSSEQENTMATKNVGWNKHVLALGVRVSCCRITGSVSVINMH